MAWELNGANNITNTRGIVGGFSWSRRNDGDCLAFECEARGDMLGIPPRGVIDFRVNGVRQFYGIAVEIPNPLSGKFGRLRAVGASELLSRTLTDPRQYDNWDVGAIARDLVTRLRHPLITGVNIPNIGATLKTFYMPYQPLSTVLETLAKACAAVGGRVVSFGVNAEGTCFFGYPAAGGALPEALPAHDPVIVGDVVSKAVIILGIGKTGGEPVEPWEAVASKTPPPSPRIPYTFTVSAQREHATYNAERAFLAPKGVKSVKTRTGGVNWRYAYGTDGNTAALSDGNPDTFMSSTGAIPGGGVQGYFVRGDVTGSLPVVGFRLVYSLRGHIFTGYPNAEAEPHQVQITMMQTNPNFDETAPFNPATFYPKRQANWSFGITEDNGQEKREAFVIWPPETWLVGPAGYPKTSLYIIFQENYDYQPDIKNADGTYTKVPPVPHPDALKVYALEPVLVNLDELGPLAEANLQLPGSAPRTIKVNGLVPPSMSGSTFDYVHNEDVLSQTTISIGQKGGATGVAQAVKTVADKAAEPTRQEVIGQVIQG